MCEFLSYYHPKFMVPSQFNGGELMVVFVAWILENSTVGLPARFNVYSGDIQNNSVVKK